MGTPIEGAIFDLDGVLVDPRHENPSRESRREFMETEWAGTCDQMTWPPNAFRTARTDDEDLLAGAGADMVVTSLDQVDVAELALGRLATLKG